MQALTSKKAILGMLSLGSLVLAGTIKDYRSHSMSSTIASTKEEEIIPVERGLASLEGAKVAQIDLPINEANNKKINGTWEITRIVGADERVMFDKFAHPEDAKKPMKVPFELVGRSLVKVNNDGQLEYHVSLLSDFGTIALFKKIGNGYEILEAKKVAEEKNNQSLVIEEEMELVLERALNQSKSNKVLQGSDVEGSVSLSAKAISALNVELRNPNGETQNIEIDTADILDGGAFKAEVNGEEVSGVVLNNGKDGYRISFVTGPIAGAMLNFVTKEQLEVIQETEREQIENQQQQQQQQQEMVNEEAPKENTQVQPQVSEETQLAAEQVIEERKDVAADPQAQEPVQVLSADEIKATAEQNGFAF